ncbi:MAG TPA: CHRD domain-containing protein [Pseudonocardiaceae bacterium]|nr:CHRD domain-containing protein [Pseudonocardiaceae bacterium]
MRHRKGVRGMGLAGAFSVSILVFAGPAQASPHEVDVAHQDGIHRFSVQLNGAESVTPGDADGQGFARLDLDPQQGTACYEITWKQLDGMVTAFHLHAARRGSDGPHWIDFFNNQNFAGSHTVKDCVRSTREKIETVIEYPSSYYLQVHSTAFDKGAIRGQLG